MNLRHLCFGVRGFTVSGAVSVYCVLCIRQVGVGLRYLLLRAQAVRVLFGLVELSGRVGLPLVVLVCYDGWHHSFMLV